MSERISPEAGRMARRMRLALAGALAAAVAACTVADNDRATTGVYRLFNSQRNPAIETLERTTEYMLVPPARALVHAPAALLVLERDLGGAREQRIVLPNDTVVRGDNMIHLRAQTELSARTEQFSFDEVTARFGGLPHPFTRATAAGLLSGSDALGSYVYAREQAGPDTVCVLVMRRIAPGARPMPRGARALDMVMRNCVVGTVEQALAPMAGHSLAVAAAPQGSVYTLSPFAAPQR